jgi:hypothetical protein
VATTVGATVQTLALDLAGLDPEEAAALREALERTGLFSIVEAGQATLAVRRIDPNAVLLTVTDGGGQRLLINEQSWPIASATPVDEETRHRRRLQYSRERLRLMPVVQSLTPTLPVVFGDLGARYPHEPVPWRFGLVGGVPTRTAPNDWVILRGPAEVLSEDDLAALLGDTALQRRLADERFWPRVAWVAGFGGLGLAGIGSGAWLSARSDRDSRTIGLSLVTVGVVSVALALLFPVVGPQHVLDAGETAQILDGYNERLRHELELSPTDLRAVDE